MSDMSSRRIATVQRRDAVVARAIEIMKSDFSQRLTSCDLASRLGCKKGYLEKAFADVKNKGIKEVLTDIRLEEVARLLRTTELTVEDIRLRAGFRNRKYFQKSFRERYTIPPVMYRRTATTG